MSPSAPLDLCCLLWAAPGAAHDLHTYEDRVLPLLREHGGVVRSRVTGDGADGHPHEVQLLAFRDRDAFDAFLADPRRAALAVERDRVVARTELFPVVERTAAPRRTTDTDPGAAVR